MTDIEQKALALVNEVNAERSRPEWRYLERPKDAAAEALCRAIEQHEAFRQEVSERDERLGEALYGLSARLLLTGFFENKDDHAAYERVVEAFGKPFIIAKPDPLVEALNDLYPETSGNREYADQLRAALAARGGRIVWEGEQ